jgi:hypothetical protein
MVTGTGFTRQIGFRAVMSERIEQETIIGDSLFNVPRYRVAEK